jgi:glutamyl-tRNA synthetase
MSAPPDSRHASASAQSPEHASRDAAPTPIVGRLAPSPTGALHLGHARSFLLAWWHARARGGRILLRIEDLDDGRSRAEHAQRIPYELEWLGLDWDGPIDVQSRARAAHDAALERLQAAGALYPCVCTRAELRSALSAPHAGDAEVAYPGTCRDRYPDLATAERASGRAAGLRMRVPPGLTQFVDGLAGAQSHDVAHSAGDFLVARRDGVLAYQLAVVIDDARQAVTEVVRGDDLLPSTARQIVLQRALGLPHPRWWHVPLVCDARGERLAKRSGATSLAALRERGLDPRALVSFIARGSGQPLGDDLDSAASELLDARAWSAHFAIERVPRTPWRVDERELDALARTRG